MSAAQLLAGEFLAPEFLQDQATPENLSRAITDLLHDDAARARLEARYDDLSPGIEARHARPRGARDPAFDRERAGNGPVKEWRGAGPFLQIREVLPAPPTPPIA